MEKSTISMKKVGHGYTLTLGDDAAKLYGTLTALKLAAGRALFDVIDRLDEA